jgi:DNA repair protein RadA/Sms
MARRTATGIDYNRAIMLIAVREKKLGFTMQNQDVYINVVGGLKIDETATDLAVILAIASNYKNFTIAHDTIVFGEVGLTGEVRAISYIDKRIEEAKKLGFKKCLVPVSNLKSVRNIKGIEIIGINTVKEAIEKICGEC